MVKQFNFKHKQHKKEFTIELNNPSINTPIPPFRYSDEIWKYGKFKGIKISETPAGYIKWCLANMKLTDVAKDILKKYLNE